jgi:hypothetical protein
MSAPDHGGSHGASGSKDGDELDADEPRTPLWLPLLGLVLFLSALIYVLVGQPSQKETAPSPQGSASAAPVAPPT